MLSFTAVDRKIALVRQIIAKEPEHVIEKVKEGEKVIVSTLQARSNAEDGFQVFGQKQERAQELLEMLFRAADFHFRWQERYHGSEVVQYAVIYPATQN